MKVKGTKITVREEKLKKKREAERRRYEQLKQDPVGRQKLKEKERIQYLKKKQSKTVKPIQEMSPREQRKKRKQWKLNSKRYRQKKKNIEEENTLIKKASPQAEKNDSPQARPIVLGKKRAARNRKRRSRELEKKNKMIQILQRKAEKYKKKFQRFKRKYEENVPPTPNTRAKQMLQEKDKSKIMKKLLFAEVAAEQMRENYKTLKSEKEKQVFKKVLSGKIIKKYHLLNYCKHVLKCGRGISQAQGISILEYKRKSSCTKMNQASHEIKNFLELDINSRICSGRKDYVTRHKVTKQKRYLCNTLKNLHQAFLKTFPQLPVSYEFFCRRKPFWIKKMKASERDTCLCVTCANMELLVLALKRLEITTSLEAVVKDLCCEEKTQDCLLRICDSCKSFQMSYAGKDLSMLTYWYKWISKRETFVDKKSENQKTVTKKAKEKLVGKVEDLIQEFEASIGKYLQHQGRKLHQYKAITALKKNMKENEVVIHMDFSENYSFKYAEETQSFHFGGSRQQITLHTVVVYSKINDTVKSESFCTVSESLRHDVPAIWAHLHPVLAHIEDTCGADTLHFVSDSPSTQYRNKTMFYTLATKLQEIYPNLKHFTWNYLESGHGKGAPDGIGGVCKRTADRLVAEGKDVANLECFVKGIIENVKAVRIFEVTEMSIEEFSAKIDQTQIQLFPGTMQVHQVKNERHNSVLLFRKLSSFMDECVKYDMGTLSYLKDDKNSSSEDEPGYSGMSDLKNSVNKVQYADVYTDDEIETDRDQTKDFCAINIISGTYILVEVKGASSMGRKKYHVPYRYVAVTQDTMDDDGEVSVTFMRECKLQGIRQVFKLDENDVSHVNFEQIVSILPALTIVLRGNRVYYQFSSVVDVFEHV